MTGPAGIKEVAAAAGVSVGTVSNVLNRPHLVRGATRERVEAAMETLGFVRNESARQLRAGSSRLLAFVVIDPGNPFFTDVARGAEEVCREAGLALVICNSGGDAAREDDYLALLLEQRVRGVLLSTADPAGQRLRTLPRLGVPVVLVDRGSTAAGDGCTVGVDDVVGGRLAAGHLLAEGHRRIAFAGGPMTVVQVAERLAGTRAALAGTDAEPLVVISTPATTVADGRDAGARLLALPAGRRPTAVVCANDLVALGVEQELVRHGVRLPEDVAVVGYDDIDLAAAAAVPLSSVRQPRDLIGRTAAELLLHEAGAGPDHVHEHVRFTPELVVRASSRRPPTG